MDITEYEQNAIDDAASAGLMIWRIGVDIHPECLMKSVRVYMVLGALEPLGTVLVANPKEEQLDNEEFDRTFHLIFAAEMDQQPILAALNTISEIDAHSHRTLAAKWPRPNRTRICCGLRSPGYRA